MYEILPRCTEHGLDAETDGLAAAVARRLEQRETEHLTVQVHRDVALHLLRKLAHHLQTSVQAGCVN